MLFIDVYIIIIEIDCYALFYKFTAISAIRHPKRKHNIDIEFYLYLKTHINVMLLCLPFSDI